MPDGLDLTTYVDNVVELHGVYGKNLATSTTKGQWGLVQQGSKWRDQMDILQSYSASNYYIDADKRLHFHALSTEHVDWSFVDYRPDGVLRIPCREVSATQDGSFIVTDALVWGALVAWDVQGEVFFGRVQDASGISKYGRWQYAEANLGQGDDQASVDQRADAIINGPPGSAGQVESGLRYPLWRFNITWFAHDVPKVAGVPQHVRPGNLVNIVLYALGETTAQPLTRVLPMRNMSVTFPQLAEDAHSWVRFDGEFGLTYSDSRYLWAYLLKHKLQPPTVPVAGGTVSNNSTSSNAGDYAAIAPLQTPDGTRTDFTFNYPLIASTVQVFVNGLLWRRYYEYDITDTGTISFYTPLAPDDEVYVEARTGASTTP